MTIRFSDPVVQYEAHKTSIDAAIRRVLESGRYMSGGEVPAFEKEFAKFMGVDHAVGVANGTDALELALRSCDVGQGDEVITVSHTAVATVAAIERVGATPVLVDVDPDFLTLDPQRLSEAVTDRTKAVIPVHLYGQPADMDAISEIAQNAGLRVIEDCAQAHGATCHNRRVGSLGDVGCFSFYPTKNLGALGDAGMVVTRDERLAEEVRQLREYGWNSRRESIVVGGNSRMDEVQAAVLREKLKWLDDDNATRAGLAARYGKVLATTQLVLPCLRRGAQHVYHLYVVRTAARDNLLDHLKSHDVIGGVHYRQPVHWQQAYRDRLRIASGLLVTEQVAGEVLSLPIYPELDEKGFQQIVTALLSFYDGK